MKLIAINPCETEDGRGPALTLRKPYEATQLDDSIFSILNDLGEEHFFNLGMRDDFFRFSDESDVEAERINEQQETFENQAKINLRIKDFKERMDEMDIEVTLTPQVKNPNRYNVDILSEENKHLSHQLRNSAVMGVIAHFVNRKWVKDWNYTYIMMNLHCITFTHESD